MRVGGLYRLTKQAVEEIEKKRWENRVLYVYFPSCGIDNQKLITFRSVDTVILPLEITKLTPDGKSPKSETSRRLKVLLPNGLIGILYVDTTEWEEVNNL